MARKMYAGNAPATTLNGAITSTTTSIVVTSGTGYPSGASGNFWIVVDRGLSSEEKILCSATSGATITAVDRTTAGNRDGTTNASHVSGAVVEHVFTAQDADEANAHVNTTTQDNHTQYLLTDGTRAPTGVTAIAAIPGSSAVGDAAAKGAGPTLATSNHVHGREAFATPVTVGTALSAGAATTVCRSDHVHTAPLGRVAYAQATASQSVTNTGADVDLTSLTVTFTFVNGRAYRITGYNNVTVPNSSAATMKLKQGSTEVAQDAFSNQVASGGSFGDALYASYVNAALSGSITFKLTLQTTGTGPTTTTATGDTSYIMVEDIGV